MQPPPTTTRRKRRRTRCVMYESRASQDDHKKKFVDDEKNPFGVVCDDGIMSQELHKMIPTTKFEDDEKKNPFDVSTRSMGRYLRGETTVEEFFLPEKDRCSYYVPHDHYHQQDQEEMPIFDLSKITNLQAFKSPASLSASSLASLSTSLSTSSPTSFLASLSSSSPSSSPSPDINSCSVDHDGGDGESLEMESLISGMGEAAQSWGFFGVVNHGVSLELIGRMRAQAQRFFQVPVQQKLKAAPSDRLPFGYFPGNPSFHPSKCWNEALQLELDPDKLQLFCDCVWGAPEEDEDEEHWHDHRESFQADFLEYTAVVGELGGRILVLLAKSLGLDPNRFKQHVRAGDSKTTLRMNHYPTCPHPDKIEGLYAHSDASMISIVHQGLVGGLQILKDDRWVGVRPNPNSFVVNIGEALMMMSNERFSSVMHRVVANSSEPRISMVFFCQPADEDVLTVAEKLTDATHPAKFIPFLWKDYMAYIWRVNRPNYYRQKGSSSNEDGNGEIVDDISDHNRQQFFGN